MGKTTVLIVEDEAIVAADLAGKLGQLGYEVIGTAAKGEEAVELASRLQPSIILMDIRLKGALDGIEAAEAIHCRMDVPVIYLTAHSDSATLERAKLTQPFGYILKPFEERDLTTHIEMALYKHESERKLREQSEWLRVTLTSIGDAVAACDVSSRITFLNPVAEALTGWKTQEVLGRPIQEVVRLINEKTGGQAEDTVALVLRDGRTKALANHTALLTRHGRQIPIEDSAAPILDASGKVIGVVLVFHDVTEKRRAREDLAESEERLRLLGDNLPDSAVYQYTHDPGGGVRFLHFSAGIERMNGVRVEDVLKDAGALHLQIAPEHFEKLAEAEVKSARELSDFDMEVPMRRPDGQVRWMRLHSRPRRMADGRILWDGVQTDVTDRKRAEEERERLIAELGAAVNELEGFTYIVSHDLRAPVRHIVGFAKLLKKEAWPTLGERGRHFLDAVLAASGKMGLLVDELLQFSRMGSVEMKKSTVDLDALIREVIRGLTEETNGRDIRWGLEPLPAVLGDASMLQLVFANLIGNALKFTRGRSPASIEIGHSNTGAEHVIFIRDNGAGFDMRYADKLFGVFQRLHSEEEFEGTGIGLANVQRIVHRHGGRIWAEGKVGEGATFSIALYKGEKMAEAPRILVADDDKGDMEIMKIVLEELGMKEETAAVRDGVEVLDYLRRRGAYEGRLPGNPDLIFLDLKMPRMNGLEALRQIRGEEGLKDIRVVIFSSSLDEKDRRESLAHGADEYVVKPIDFEEFQSVMERVVNTYVAR